MNRAGRHAQDVQRKLVSISETGEKLSKTGCQATIAFVCKGFMAVGPSVDTLFKTSFLQMPGCQQSGPNGGHFGTQSSRFLTRFAWRLRGFCGGAAVRLRTLPKPPRRIPRRLTWFSPTLGASTKPASSTPSRRQVRAFQRASAKRSPVERAGTSPVQSSFLAEPSLS